MALSDPIDTLAYHLSRPLTAARDVSAVPAAKVAQAVKAFLAQDTEAETRPEAEALWFYALNQGMALLRAEKALYEPLGADQQLVNSYYDVLTPKAIRAFYYLLLICIREARHLDKQHKVADKATDLFGPGAWSMIQDLLASKGENYKLFLDKPPETEIGKITGLLAFVFHNGAWGGGYGGKAWGAVADCLHRFVAGVLTPEMMLDTVWTLAHNNGPIFNKGMLYGGYTTALQTILDVQRSGQIVELVRQSHEVIKGFITPDLMSMCKHLHARYPGKVGDYVDWFAVEALGAVGHYGKFKQAQTVAHGVTAKASEAEKKVAAKAAADAKTAAEAKVLYEKTHFTIMPGLVVKKFQRAA